MVWVQDDDTFCLRRTQCSLPMRGLWESSNWPNVDISGGLSCRLCGMSRAYSAKAGHDVSEPYGNALAFSVFGNLMVEGVIDGDSTTTMVFGACGGPIAE